jgi:hypothetical protein
MRGPRWTVVEAQSEGPGLINLSTPLALAIELLAEIARRLDLRPGRPYLVDQTAV